MTDSTPKYSDLREQQLKRLGDALLALTPEKRQEALRIAGKLLAIKARKRAQAELAAHPKTSGNDTEPAPGASMAPASPLPSELPPALDSAHSPLPNGSTLPGTTRLTPSEIESLRQESREALAWMAAQLAK